MPAPTYKVFSEIAASDLVNYLRLVETTAKRHTHIAVVFHAGKGGGNV